MVNLMIFQVGPLEGLLEEVGRSRIRQGMDVTSTSDCLELMLHLS